MSALQSLLSEIISGSQKVAILGAGSPLLGDDAAGNAIAEALADRLSSDRAAVYCGCTAPENFTGVIKRFQPDALLIIDAADMGLPTGAVALIDPCEVGGVSFSTHMLPLKIMLEYLKREIGCKIYILGIQGACLDFGAELSPEVRSAVHEVTNALLELLSE